MSYRPPPAPPVSPLVYDFSDYTGRAIYCSVFFDEVTHELDRIEIVRDEGCLWRRVFLGLGDDGSPDTSARKFTVPEGTNATTVNKGQLRSMELATLQDFNSHQITAGL